MYITDRDRPGTIRSIGAPVPNEWLFPLQHVRAVTGAVRYPSLRGAAIHEGALEHLAAGWSAPQQPHRAMSARQFTDTVTGTPSWMQAALLARRLANGAHTTWSGQ